MRRILVTGISGTGKSSALAELANRGYRVVDTDDAGWREYRPFEAPIDELPVLRTSCTHELDASRPLDAVVADLIAIAERP